MYVVMCKDKFVGLGPGKKGLRLHPFPVKTSVVDYNNNKDDVLVPFFRALGKEIKDVDTGSEEATLLAEMRIVKITLTDV